MFVIENSPVGRYLAGIEFHLANALQLFNALQLSSFIARPWYRIHIIPSVFILGYIYALPRIAIGICFGPSALIKSL